MPLQSAQDHRPRVEVSETAANGRSRRIASPPPLARVENPVATVNDVWVVDEVPTTAAAYPSSSADYQLLPARRGVKVFTVAFAPDAEWENDAGAQDAGLSSMQVEGSVTESSDGFHRTPTVDVITVISGEVVALLDDSEIRLAPGDSFVQRATHHTWRNRGDVPAVAVVTMISATD